MIQKWSAVGIVLLFLGSSIVTMLVPAEQQDLRTHSLYDCYHLSNAIPSSLPVSMEEKACDTPVTGKTSQTSNSGLMNSSWPMYCHDTHHTGRSPYITTENLGKVKWTFKTQKPSFYGSTIIDSEGTIYTAAYNLYALYPNGTLKWEFDLKGMGESCPAIDENGIIYIGTALADPNYFYAIYPNGTMKWRYWIGGGTDILSSPTIGTNGMIYFGCGQSIVALYPNGTLRWQCSTDHVVYSSPAIGDDGTIYCGCHDTYLYALYSYNGTVKWKFKTGDWIRTSPCIVDDGTIYCASWDGYLYALCPNGTMKWRTYVGAGTSPTIAQDGTIYAGYSQLYAINPVNGSVKWYYDIDGRILGGTPCNSIDGMIYFGTIVNIIDGYLVALNPNGTERWKTRIGECESAPAIGEDGTIYIGSIDNNGDGHFYAFSPEKISIEKPEPGKLYLFGVSVCKTLIGNTVIIGSVKVKVHAESWNEIKSIHFYFDGIDQYNLTKPPFEWRMNKRDEDLFPLNHTIMVTGYYQDGCRYSDSIVVFYFHL